MNDIDIRNAENLAAWRKRWAAQRGSSFLSVDSYADLRNDDQLQRWRKAQFAIRQRKARGKVVNIAEWYLRRARNGHRRSA